MANLGDIKTSYDYQVLKQGPLDSRLKKKRKEDLISKDSWASNNGVVYVYPSMMVTIEDTNDVYLLKDVNKIYEEDYSGWKLIGKSSEIYVGTQQPTDEDVKIWINPEENPEKEDDDIIVDSKLSFTSTNPLQNKAIASALEAGLAKKQDMLISGVNIKTINKQSLVGAGNINIDLSPYITKEKVEKDYITETVIQDTYLNKTDAESTYLTKTDAEETYQLVGDYALNSELDSKQNTLVSGTNIKTINNQSILGSGNIIIEGGGTAAEGAKLYPIYSPKLMETDSITEEQKAANKAAFEAAARGDNMWCYADMGYAKINAQMVSFVGTSIAVVVTLITGISDIDAATYNISINEDGSIMYEMMTEVTSPSIEKVENMIAQSGGGGGNNEITIYVLPYEMLEILKKEGILIEEMPFYEEMCSRNAEVYTRIVNNGISGCSFFVDQITYFIELYKSIGTVSTDLVYIGRYPASIEYSNSFSTEDGETYIKVSYLTTGERPFTSSFFIYSDGRFENVYFDDIQVTYPGAELSEYEIATNKLVYDNWNYLSRRIARVARKEHENGYTPHPFLGVGASKDIYILVNGTAFSKLVMTETGIPTISQIELQ